MSSEERDIQEILLHLKNISNNLTALYILPGQKWTMKMTPLVDVKGGGGNEGTAIGMMVYYTLYDGPDSLIANKLVEMGIPVSSDNVDWYKMNMISKNLTNLTMTGGVA